MLQRLRPWAAAAAATALLLAQAAGLAHRIEHEVGHGPAGSGGVPGHAMAAHGHAGHDHASQDGPACDESDHGHAHGHDSAIGGAHDEGSATCRLIDQAAHADAAPGAALPATLPAATPEVPAPRGVQAIAKAGAQPYRARGPPPTLA